MPFDWIISLLAHTDLVAGYDEMGRLYRRERFRLESLNLRIRKVSGPSVSSFDEDGSTEAPFFEYVPGSSYLLRAQTLRYPDSAEVLEILIPGELRGTTSPRGTFSEDCNEVRGSMVA